MLSRLLVSDWLKKPARSGTEMPAATAPFETLIGILDRRTALPSLEALKAATLAPGGRDAFKSALVAIGFDTNAALRLTDRKRELAVDYLVGRHPGPIIVPGQVIQEFWKNSLSEIKTVGASVLGKYQSIADQVRKLSIDVAPFDARFQELVDEFAQQFGLTYEPETERRIAAVLEALERRAIVPYVPRTMFQPLATIRDQTKTPPGFKDLGHGDFFVWADFLYGLLLAQDAGRTFESVVLVTDDQKIDWSRGPQAHPLLVAEVQALLNKPFQTWTLARLDEYVASQLSTVDDVATEVTEG